MRKAPHDILSLRADKRRLAKLARRRHRLASIASILSCGLNLVVIVLWLVVVLSRERLPL
jgi:hypothetical protein